MMKILKYNVKSLTIAFYNAILLLYIICTGKILLHNSDYVVQLSENIKAQYYRTALNKTNEKIESFIGLIPMHIL